MVDLESKESVMHIITRIGRAIAFFVMTMPPISPIQDLKNTNIQRAENPLKLFCRTFRS